MKKNRLSQFDSTVNSLAPNKSFFLKSLFQKTKSLLFLFTLSFYSLNAFTQNTSLISDCSDFVIGTNTSWSYVLEATSKRYAVLT